jgi:hypothetical protein
MGFSPSYILHSGAQLDKPEELKHAMVLGGIAMYGYHPGAQCGPGPISACF